MPLLLKQTISNNIPNDHQRHHAMADQTNNKIGAKIFNLNKHMGIHNKEYALRHPPKTHNQEAVLIVENWDISQDIAIKNNINKAGQIYQALLIIRETRKYQLHFRVSW